MKIKRFLGWFNLYWGDVAWYALVVYQILWMFAFRNTSMLTELATGLFWLMYGLYAVYTIVALFRLIARRKRGLRDVQYVLLGALMLFAFAWFASMLWQGTVWWIGMMDQFDAAGNLARPFVDAFVMARFAIWAHKRWQVWQAKKTAPIGEPEPPEIVYVGGLPPRGEGVAQFLVENDEGEQ